MKRIIHIEDSVAVFKEVKEKASDWFGTENLEITNLDFEKSAANFIEENGAADVVLILVDMMVDYQEDDRLPIPIEVLKEGSFEAGFRLIQRLKDSPVWKSVPLLIYSSVAKAEVEARAAVLGLADVKVYTKTYTLEPLMLGIQEIVGLNRLKR